MVGVSRRGLFRGAVTLAGGWAGATLGSPTVGTPAAGAAAASSGSSGWQADPAVIARNKREHPGLIFEEELVPAYELPDPLRRLDGSVVEGRAGWASRRRELRGLFRTHVYGRRAPGVPLLRFELLEEDRSAMAGTATLRRVLVHSRAGPRTHGFEVITFVPNAATGPVPTFLLLNNRGPENTDPTRETLSEFWPAEEVVGRGYGIAALQVGDLAPDDPDHFRDGVIRLFEGDRPPEDREPDAWEALAAWSWGASRALDYFRTDPRIDARRVAVVGHSRGGKASLWAGAEDERFALVISNDSGCGGAALARRRFGETVAVINEGFPHWFCSTYDRYGSAVDDLPVDQHELVALIAPRAVYLTSADEDLWADPRGTFLSLAHSSPVYGLWDEPPIAPEAMPALDSPLVSGRRGYHVRSGEHDLTLVDWSHFLDYADGLWPPS